MRALKILVVVMAAMILAGLTALAIVVAGRLTRGGPGPAASGPIAAAPIELPAGARVETMSLGGDRLVVDIVLPDGNRRLVVIDLATGRQLGIIPLQTAP